MTEKVRKILEENNCLEEFVIDCLLYSNHSTQTVNDSNNIVMEAFQWNQTKRGFDWNKIHKLCIKDE